MTEAFIGIYIFVSIFTLSKYFFTSDRSYLYYSLYVLLTGFYLTFDPYERPFPKAWLDTGYGHFFYYFLSTLLLLSYVFYYRFVKSFLRLDEDITVVGKYLTACSQVILVFFCCHIFGLLLGEQTAIWLELLYLLGVIVMSLYGIVLLARLPLILSKIVILGTSLYLIGSVLGFIDNIFSIFDDDHFFSFAPLGSTIIGFSLEVVLFTIAYNYRTGLIERERIETHRLKEFYDIKSDFYASVSHELRTPLTIIKGLTQELDGHAEYKERINGQCSDMLRLINDMLDLSKLDAGMMERTDTALELVSFMKVLLDSYSSLAQSRGLRLTLLATMDALPLLIDQDKLKTVLSNLIVNAIHYAGGQGSYIEVSVDVQKGSKLSIRVSDDGPGIEASDKPHIFERYYRSVHAEASSPVVGSGVGLSLVANYVAMMDGSVELHDNSPSGCVFIIQLPIIEPILSPISEARGDHAKVGGDIMDSLPGAPEDRWVASIAVIEDNADVADYVMRLLNKHGYEARWAHDGVQGVALCREWIPDIIISDVMMPRMDGYAFCKAIKTDPLTDHVPIIMLTAKATHQDKVQGIGLGADAYLAKPFEADELLAHIHQMISQQERLRRHYAATSEELARPIAETEKHSFVCKVEQLMDDHLPDPSFGVEQLSNALYMDRTQVYRKLKSLTGYTPSQLLKKRRLSRAVDCLKQESDSIADIADKCGFTSQSYFSRAFSEVYNCSPSQYRSRFS